MSRYIKVVMCSVFFLTIPSKVLHQSIRKTSYQTLQVNVNQHYLKKITMKSGLFFSAVFISGALAAPVVELESDAALSVSKRQTNFLSLVEKFFPADVSLNNTSTAETKLISTAGTALAKAAGITTSENDVGTGAACSDMTIIFARGTTEPGTVGVLAGPPFFDAVKAQLGSSATLSVQGVDYPADIPGFLEGGDKAGSQTM